MKLIKCKSCKDGVCGICLLTYRCPDCLGLGYKISPKDKNRIIELEKELDVLKKKWSKPRNNIKSINF